MKKKILIVDDADISREILRDLLGDTYEIEEAVDGDGALRKIREMKDELSVVLLDLRMPDMDGFEVCAQLKKEKITPALPVIVLTADVTLESEILCFDIGCFDYIRKPFSQTLLTHRIENAVLVHEKRAHLEGEIQRKNELLQEAIVHLRQEADILSASLQESVDVIGILCAFRTLRQREYSQNIRDYTEILGRKYMELYPNGGLTDKALDQIVLCAPMANFGKIEIPERILMKPGPLTAEEFQLVKSHTYRGKALLPYIPSLRGTEYETLCGEICMYHHERYDGSGYPEGRSGDDIPLSAQLVGMATVYSSLQHDTAYRAAFSKDEAYRMMVEGECGAFSPQLLLVLETARFELEAVRSQ